MEQLKVLVRYMGPRYRRDAALGALLVAVETSLELLIPVLMARIIDEGIPRRDMVLILRQGVLMLLLAAFSLVLGLLYSRLSANAAQGLGANLRDAEYAAIQRFAFSNLDHYQTSSLVTRMTTDITVIQNAIANGFRPMVRGPVMGVMALVYSFAMNAELAVVFVCVMPVLAVALALITRRVAPLYRDLQECMDDLNGVLQEDFTAIRAVKAYVREDFELIKFDTVNRLLAQTSTTTFGTAVLNLPLFQLSMYTASTLILLLGGQMIIAGTMQVGELTGFMSYVLQVMNSLMMISNVFLLLTRALTSVDRVREVLDEKPALATPAGGGVQVVADGAVEFHDVSFRYRDDAEHNVLEGVDLAIPAGATVGVLGGTGSGKSSLVQLIARLYDASAGEVLVGGVDVRDYNLAALRDAVAVVLQKNVLFTGTVRENLAWGDPAASDEQMLEACRLACADEFLDRIGGLDAPLGREGAGVSGGQRQRLCIARALLKHPRVIVFDDSTSACDMSTDAQIRANIAGIEGATVVVIAQRIASVMGSDLIVVMDDGRVHAVGTHDELLARNAIYQEIYASQMEFAGEDDKVAAGAGTPADVKTTVGAIACGADEPGKGGEAYA